MKKSKIINSIRLRFALFSVVLMLGTVSDARAYKAETHQKISASSAALIGELEQEKLPCPDKDDLLRFRQWVDSEFRRRLKSPLDTSFTAQIPETQGFDKAMVFRNFLNHNTDKSMPGTTGIDRAPGCESATPAELLSLGSSVPSTDKRNQNRLHRDEKGALILDADGDAIPTDPAILHLGPPTGIQSEWSAHFALPKMERSSNPDVLAATPEQFAMPFEWRGRSVETSAAAQAQIHFDLAEIALAWNDPKAPALAWIFLGSSLHYLQNAANPLQTVQVCDFEFFREARIQSVLSMAQTLVGFLWDYRDFPEVARTVLFNHVVAAESIAHTLYRSQDKKKGQPFPGFSPKPLDLEKAPEALQKARKAYGKLFLEATPIATLVDKIARKGMKSAPEICKRVTSVLRSEYRDGHERIQMHYSRLTDLVDPQAESILLNLTAASTSYQKALLRAITLPAVVIEYFISIQGAETSPETREARLDALVSRMAQKQLQSLKAEADRRASFLGDMDTQTGYTRKEKTWRWTWQSRLAGMIVLLLISGIITFIRHRRARAKAKTSPPAQAARKEPEADPTVEPQEEPRPSEEDPGDPEKDPPETEG